MSSDSKVILNAFLNFEHANDHGKKFIKVQTTPGPPSLA